MPDVEDFNLDGEELVESMRKLQEIHVEIAKITVEERSKVLEVKRKYIKLRRALYNTRNEIIQSISGFWVAAFLNHPALADKVSEEDKKVFKYMVSLEVEDLEGEQSGYSITFNFSPNPFFEHTKLTKTYSLSEDGPTSVTGTTIKWKDGENIAAADSARENIGAKRHITEDSFFSWFSEQQKILPTHVYDTMAKTIREELWADPLNYFCNEAYDEDVNGRGLRGSDNDDEDFNGTGSNDPDNDHDDEGDDDEAFNMSDDDDNDDENVAQDEIAEEQHVEPEDDAD